MRVKKIVPELHAFRIDESLLEKVSEFPFVVGVTVNTTLGCTIFHAKGETGCGSWEMTASGSFGDYAVFEKNGRVIIFTEKRFKEIFGIVSDSPGEALAAEKQGAVDAIVREQVDCLKSIQLHPETTVDCVNRYSLLQHFINVLCGPEVWI